MANSVVIPITMIIIFSVLVYRMNANAHKNNYKKFLVEIEEDDSKYKNELSILMKYISKHHEMQEMNQYTYILIMIIILTVFFYNI